jgi:alkyl sulfatase BDS1-like metallo-beta-lactamase superfamily hydrolase
MIEMPPALDAQWHTHGYYGTVNHDVKAIYQRYLGWWDCNPARYWQHPPEAAAARYVETPTPLTRARERCSPTS